MVAPAHARMCRLSVLEPAESARAGLELSLGEPDDRDHPTAWQGPLIVRTANGARCEMRPQLGILTTPILHDGGRLLVVTTYSGSNQQIEALDLTSCRVVLKSPKVAAAATYANGTISLGALRWGLSPDCALRPR
jgi:hypothetical protein